MGEPKQLGLITQTYLVNHITKHPSQSYDLIQRDKTCFALTKGTGHASTGPSMTAFITTTYTWIARDGARTQTDSDMFYVLDGIGRPTGIARESTFRAG